MSRMDTNAAYQLATQWLQRSRMSAALNRDCKLVISAWTPEGENGQHFVRCIAFTGWQKENKDMEMWLELSA